MLARQLLNYDVPSAVDRDALAHAFEHFIRREVPYETVSNLVLSRLVKSAAEMVETVADGLGGHCVEHAVLLTEFLRELGFDARFANADYHDRVSGRSTAMAKPLCLVRVGETLFVADPYYRQVLLPVPREGELRVGRFVVVRKNDEEFWIQALKLDAAGAGQGAVLNEDHVHALSTLHDRCRLFEARYAEFSPFGITAPYFQLMRPVRKALFYDPEQDCLVDCDPVAVRELQSEDLAKCEWIPERVRHLVLEFVGRSRAMRPAARRFLARGEYAPHYLQLERRSQHMTESDNASSHIRGESNDHR
ncbi:MAG: hypothetical protein RJA70_1009 [Pseudomonadota bacterium]|jgi:hypothetical protein